MSWEPWNWELAQVQALGQHSSADGYLWSKGEHPGSEGAW